MSGFWAGKRYYYTLYLNARNPRFANENSELTISIYKLRFLEDTWDLAKGKKSSDPVFSKIADPVYRFSIRNITTTTTTGSFFLIFQIVNFYADLQAIS